MSDLILNILDQGLILMNKLVPDQAVKLQERLNAYRTEWDAEIAKGAARDDGKLAYLDNELRNIGAEFVTCLKSASSQSKP